MKIVLKYVYQHINNVGEKDEIKSFSKKIANP